MKKAVIFDIDGTAIDFPTHKISTPRLQRSIEQLQKSYYVSADTGRPWKFAKNIFAELGLTDPCAIAGGTQLCNPKTGEIIWQQNIPGSAIQQIRSILASHPSVTIIYNDFSESDYLAGGMPILQAPQPQVVHYFLVVNLPTKNVTKITAQFDLVEDILYTVTNAHKKGCKDIQVTHVSAGKGKAAEALHKLYGIASKDSYGIGDGNNDLPLLEACGNKIAMENATPQLKEIADVVIADVKADGLAAYFESLSMHKS